MKKKKTLKKGINEKVELRSALSSPVNINNNEKKGVGKKVLIVKAKRSAPSVSETGGCAGR